MVMLANRRHDTGTPTLSVVDSRGLTVRTVGYCRQTAVKPAQARVTRCCFDQAGRLVRSWDPRLWALAAKPNSSICYSLSSQALLSESVDSGWQLALFNDGRQPVLAWDGRGGERRTHYDGLQRVTSFHERQGEAPFQVVERFLYGDASAADNLCGQLIRHDNPAGSLTVTAYGVVRQPLSQTQRLLKALDDPDWPLDVHSRDQLLESDLFVTERTYNPWGDLLSQCDATGNRRLYTHTVAGQPKAIGLCLAGANSVPQWLVSDRHYNAFGQVERETAANGVTTTAFYAPDNGRLLRLRVAAGTGKCFQDLTYIYDAVGNILSLEDRVQAIRYFKNQKVDAANRYRYDTLYRLIEASGREVLVPAHGPHLPVVQPVPLDPGQLRRYTQTFHYDAAGNLSERHHTAAPTMRMFTSSTSNRSLAQRDDGSLPDEHDIAQAFDGNGNQQQLQPGQQMSWDLRNQLSRVTQVVREDAPNDVECYRYDTAGHRLRKVRLVQARSRIVRSEVLYFPGVEMHRCGVANTEHHLISVEAGYSQVRVLRREGANDQVYYGFNDHLRSCTLELDEQARLVSQEWYYPFGGTACWVARSAIEAKYKTVRYSGKERDATGLYFYGYRYYAPWLQRWVSADPLGEVDGLNLYVFVVGNPVNKRDRDGRMYEGMGDAVEARIYGRGMNIEARGLDQFSPGEQFIVGAAFEDALMYVSDAISMAENYPQESAGRLKAYFGVKQSYQDVIASWKMTKSLLAQFATKQGKAKLVKVSEPQRQTVEAFVDTQDVHGRIMINGSRISGHIGFVATLIHEASHLRSVSGFAEMGPATRDHWYIEGQMSASARTRGQKVQDTSFINSSRKKASAFVLKPVTDQAFASWSERVKDSFALKVNELTQGYVAANDFPAALNLFNQYPALRSDMAVHVADQLAFAAIDLSRDYQTLQRRQNAKRPHS